MDQFYWMINLVTDLIDHSFYINSLSQPEKSLQKPTVQMQALTSFIIHLLINQKMQSMIASYLQLFVKRWSSYILDTQILPEICSS